MSEIVSPHAVSNNSRTFQMWPLIPAFIADFMKKTAIAAQWLDLLGKAFVYRANLRTLTRAPRLFRSTMLEQTRQRDSPHSDRLVYWSTSS